MEVEFTMYVPDRASGQAVAEVAPGAGFKPSLYFSEEHETWSVYCAKVLVASYDNLIAGQVELQQLAAPHGGEVDGWVTAGNAESPS